MGDMAFAQLMRLIWIDHHLATGSLLRRRAIHAAFGIGIAQASLDIRAYERLHPGRLHYNASAKGYTLRAGVPAAFPGSLRVAVQTATAEMASVLAVRHG